MRLTAIEWPTHTSIERTTLGRWLQILWNTRRYFQLNIYTTTYLIWCTRYNTVGRKLSLPLPLKPGWKIQKTLFFAQGTTTTNRAGLFGLLVSKPQNRRHQQLLFLWVRDPILDDVILCVHTTQQEKYNNKSDERVEKICVRPGNLSAWFFTLMDVLAIYSWSYICIAYSFVRFCVVCIVARRG